MPMAQAIQWQSFYYSHVREYALKLNYSRMTIDKSEDVERKKILNG